MALKGIKFDDEVLEVPQAITDLTQDAQHQTVSQDEKDSWNNKANQSDIPTDYVTTNTTQTINADKTIVGNLTIQGNITQNGSDYITHAEKIYTNNDYIIMRDGATGGLGSGYSGFEVIRYNGTDNGRLAIGADGVARVGDVGDEQPLATREETPIDNGFAKWDGTNKKFVTTTISSNDLTDKANLATSTDLNALTARVGTNETNITNLQTQVTENSDDIATNMADIASLQTSKQNTLTAGENITIENNVISASGGTSIIVDSELSTTSENPVQNKVVTTALQDIISKPTDTPTSNGIQLPSNNIWRACAYGNGLYAALGENANSGEVVAIYSQDGINWSQGTVNMTWEGSIVSPTTIQVSGMAFGNGKFVAVGSGNCIISTNGIDWYTLQNENNGLIFKANFQRIAFGNGKFVAIGSLFVASPNNQVSYSEDGENWVDGTLPSSMALTSIAFGNDRFIAIQTSNINCLYSDDGINWVSSTRPSGSYSNFTYGNGKFVALRDGQEIYSEDGISWNSITIPAGPYKISFGDGIFIALAGGTSTSSASDKAMLSKDGISWTEFTLSASVYPSSARAYGLAGFVYLNSSSDSGMLIGVSDRLVYNSDLDNYLPKTGSVLPLTTQEEDYYLVSNANGDLYKRSTNNVLDDIGGSTILYDSVRQSTFDVKTLEDKINELAQYPIVEAFYDMNSTDETINQGYTSGLPSGKAIYWTNENYDLIRLYAQMNGFLGYIEVPLEGRPKDDLLMMAQNATGKVIHYLRGILYKQYKRFNLGNRATYTYATDGTLTVETSKDETKFFLTRAEGVISKPRW